jgi:hypothetical protein
MTNAGEHILPGSRAAYFGAGREANPRRSTGSTLCDQKHAGGSAAAGSELNRIYAVS